eukprot:Opistho-1_new@58740
MPSRFPHAGHALVVVCALLCALVGMSDAQQFVYSCDCNFASRAVAVPLTLSSPSAFPLQECMELCAARAESVSMPCIYKDDECSYPACPNGFVYLNTSDCEYKNKDVCLGGNKAWCHEDTSVVTLRQNSEECPSGVFAYDCKCMYRDGFKTMRAVTHDAVAPTEACSQACAREYGETYQENCVMVAWSCGWGPSTCTDGVIVSADCGPYTSSCLGSITCKRRPMLAQAAPVAGCPSP